jgi:uncharacterized membrane protein required for colicin V production
VSFGPFDLVVVVVLVAGFIHGRSKGLAWQLSGIATLALGYVAAAAGSSVLAPIFPDAWPIDVKRFAAWIAVYALVSVGVYLVTLKLSKKIKEHELEELDRRFGGALGAFKAGLLLAVVSLVTIATSERARALVKESASGVLLARAAYAARPLLPAKIGEAVAKIAGEIAPEPLPAPAPARPQPPRPAPPQAAPRTTPPARPLAGQHRLQPAPPPPPPPAPSPRKPAFEDESNAGDDEPGMNDDEDKKSEPADPLLPPKR